MLMNKAVPTKSRKTNKKEKGTGKHKSTKKVVNNDNINNTNCDTNSKSKYPKRVAKFETLKDLINNNSKLLECIENSRLNRIYDQIKSDKVDPHYFPEGNLFIEKRNNSSKKKKKAIHTIPSESTINTEVLRKLQQSYNLKKDPRGPQPTIIKTKAETDVKTKKSLLTIEAAKKVIEQTFRLPNTSEFTEPFKKLVGTLEINLDSEESFQRLPTPRTVMEERAFLHHERKTKRILEEMAMRKKMSNADYEKTDSKNVQDSVPEGDVQSHYNKTRLKNFEETVFKELSGPKTHDEAAGDGLLEPNQTIKTKTSYNSQLEIDSIDWANICNLDNEISKKISEINEKKEDIIDNLIELPKKGGICDEFFDCCEHLTSSKYFDETYDRLVMSTVKPFEADCCPYIETIESNMEITPNPSELYNFKKLLKQCNKIRKQPNNRNNILSNEDMKLLNDIVQADEKYHKFHKEDHLLLKEVLQAQLNQVEQQKNIVDDVLKSLRSSKSEIINMNKHSRSQDDLFRSPVPSKILSSSSKTTSNLSEKCNNDRDLKTMIAEIPLSSEKESSLNASLNDNDVSGCDYDEEAARLATEIRVIFKNLPISETSDSDTFVRNLSSRISKIPNLEKITQILESESNVSMAGDNSPQTARSNKPAEIDPTIEKSANNDEEENYDNISIKSSNCSTPMVSVRVSVKPKQDAMKPPVIEALPDTPESQKQRAQLDNYNVINEIFQNNSNYCESESHYSKTGTQATDDSVIRATTSKIESIEDIQSNRPKSARSYFTNNSKDQQNQTDFSNIKSYLASCKDLSPYQSYLRKFPSIHDILDRIDSPRSVFTLISDDNFNISSLSNFQCNKIIFNNADDNIVGFNQNNNVEAIEIITINQMTPLCHQYVFHMYDFEYYSRVEAFKTAKIDCTCLMNACYQAQEYRIQLLSLSDLKIIKEFYVPEQQLNNEFQLKKTNFFELISKPDELYTVVKNPDIINQLKITKENFNFSSILNNKIKISKSLNKLFNNKNMDEILFEVYETDSNNVCKFSKNLFNITKLEAGDYEFDSSNNCQDILSVASGTTLSTTTTTTTLLLSDSRSTQDNSKNSDSNQQASKACKKQQNNSEGKEAKTGDLKDGENDKQANEQEIKENRKEKIKKRKETETASGSINEEQNVRRNRRRKYKHKQIKKILKLITIKTDSANQADNNNINNNNNNENIDHEFERNKSIDNGTGDAIESFNSEKFDPITEQYERFKKMLVVFLHISIFALLIWALKNPLPYCLDI